MTDRAGAGLIFAHRLDGRGGATQLEWTDAEAWTPDAGPIWVHLDRGAAETAAYCADHAGLDPLVADVLLAEETRPRTVAMGGGLVLVLRGVNLNPGAEVDDMVALRVWVEPLRVITTRGRRVKAAEDLREALQRGTGPRSTPDLLVRLITRLTDRAGPIIEDLDDRVDALEDRLLTEESREIRPALLEVRRQAISLRRHLAPQRDALARIQTEDVSWLDARDKARIREAADRVTRYVEDLEEVRERAAVIQDELMNRLSEQMNKTMYLLSVVAAVMLPLGLLTGLLGINVGGIPGTESRWAFAVVCLLLGAIATAQVWTFRRMNWL